MYEKKRFSIKKILFSQVFIIVGLIVLALFLVALSKEVLRGYQINRDLDDLKNEITGLETENSKFTDLIEYLKSQDYAEKEARKRMNLKKAGESIAVIETSEQIQPAENTKEETNNSLAVLSNTGLDGEIVSNPGKWWIYFFGENSN